MANESTYASITDLVGHIYQIALLTAEESDVMSSLVTRFSSNGSAPRVWSEYSGGTFATITESTDMTPQEFNPSASGTITPSMFGQQSFIPDTRLDGDPMPVQSDYGRYIGGKAGSHIDTNLVGLFSSFTGGTVGTAGGTLTWTNILRGQAYLRTNKVTGRYACVLHPVQWYYLTSATSGVPTLMQNTSIAEGVFGGFYQASFSNMDFYADANISSGTACTAAMFGQEAAAIDIRRPLRLEPQRDASRGGGGWELNPTMQYGYGVYRPTYGVQLIGTSA